MKKIGLMGGTFDPIHNAHISLAKYAKKQYNLDSVIFMTGGNPPHKKDKCVTDAKIRYEMTKIAIDGIDGFFASDYEVNKEDYSYSVNTLKWLLDKYKDAQIYFIIGEDSLSYIDKWYKPQEIVSLCTLLVYPRVSMETLRAMAQAVKSNLGGDIKIINAPVFNISSTDIRERIKQGLDVNEMLPYAVYEYIKDNKLYGN